MIKKNLKIKDEDLKDMLKDWQGANGCFATDKITVDGLKVGFMYRENPVNAFDSGWRFFAGTESTGYVNNPENSGAYTLNRLCNCDPDILPFLDNPFGCCFERNKMGVFEPSELE